MNAVGDSKNGPFEGERLVMLTPGNERKPKEGLASMRGCALFLGKTHCWQSCRPALGKRVREDGVPERVLRLVWGIPKLELRRKAGHLMQEA